MTIRDQILVDIEKIQNIRMLYQILDFVSVLRKHYGEWNRNVDAVLACAGSLPGEDAEEIRQDIENQFNEIEGEW